MTGCSTPDGMGFQTSRHFLLRAMKELLGKDIPRGANCPTVLVPVCLP